MIRDCSQAMGTGCPNIKRQRRTFHQAGITSVQFLVAIEHAQPVDSIAPNEQYARTVQNASKSAGAICRVTLVIYLCFPFKRNPTRKMREDREKVD